MRTRLRWLPILALTATLGCLGAASHAQIPATPPVPGIATVITRRLPDMPVHDPWILVYKPTRTYYLYSSASPRVTGSNRYGTLVYKSKDLAHWQGPFVVFQIPDGGWANPADGAWAPEVHPYHGKYYLFVTLHNNDKPIDRPPASWQISSQTTHMRGTTVAVSDSPDGPFTLLQNRPYPPEDFMTLDGTLYRDPAGVPWMVYCHEWVQKVDGTVEAVRLAPDLSKAVGSPIHLFKGSDAPWLNAQATPDKTEPKYVTDGVELYRTTGGRLLMLWSSYDKGGYVETLAASKSGNIQGPWEQLPPLVRQDSGHGMLFTTFTGHLMMVLHRPFHNARAKLYDMEDTGTTLRVLRERMDLDGPGQ